MKSKLSSVVFFFALLLSVSGFSQQDGFVGEIRMFAGNFAPSGWAFCDGSLYPVSEYQALFSILGTTYGGDGTTTFALPDLRGRLPMGIGSAPDLTARTTQGQKIGSETNTLTEGNMPSHSHSVAASRQGGTTSDPSGAFLADSNTFDKEYTVTSDTTMSAAMIGETGEFHPVNNLQPSLTIRFIICIEGLYPSRE